jgi:hypothetical protein
LEHISAFNRSITRGQAFFVDGEERIGCALTHWLSPVFGENLMLATDTDKIEALNADRRPASGSTLWRQNTRDWLPDNLNMYCHPEFPTT